MADEDSSLTATIEHLGQFAVTDDKAWRFGTDDTCAVRLPESVGPADTWFVVRRLGSWTAWATGAGVVLLVNARAVPSGRTVTLDLSKPVRIVARRDTETVEVVITRDCGPAPLPPPDPQGTQVPDATVISNRSRVTPPPAPAPAPTAPYTAPVAAPIPAPAPFAPAPPPVQQHQAPDGTVIRIQQLPPGPHTTTSMRAPAPPPSSGASAIRLDADVRYTIGRDGGPAQIKLYGSDIAAVHCEVRWSGDRLQVSDRSRGLGTYVDGIPVGVARLSPGDRFTVGHQVLVVGRSEIQVITLRSQAPAMVISGLHARYRTRADLALVDLSFTLPANSFLTIVGPSGAGKSSLCRVLLGEMQYVAGIAQFQDFDLRTGTHWPVISFVPQAESLAIELTVAETLELVARVRLARDLTAQARSQRVGTVLEAVDMTASAHKRLDTLSGGQRRRLSVAMELLSDPLLLILDEPTSGLDEGLDRMMMLLLKDLAANGTSVVLITHSTSNLELADYALALTNGGRIGYFGPAGEIRDNLQQADYADVMDRLRSGHAAAPQAAAAAAIPATPRPTPPKRTAVVPMLAREVRRVARRPAWLLSNLLLVPLIVAGLAAVAGSGDGLNPAALHAKTPSHAGTVLSVLAILISFFAAQTSFTSIVADRDLIRREARWGLSTGSVVWSRALLACTISVFQGGAAVVIWLAIEGAPTTNLNLPSGLELLISICLLALASCALGLFVSALADTIEKAVFYLMGISAMQVVLSGLVIGLAGDGKAVINAISFIAPTRWGVASEAASIDLTHIQPGNVPPDKLWFHDVAHQLAGWGVLASMTVLFLGGAWYFVDRAAKERQ